jgi:hypothetical protein
MKIEVADLKEQVADFEPIMKEQFDAVIAN